MKHCIQKAVILLSTSLLLLPLIVPTCGYADALPSPESLLGSWTDLPHQFASEIKSYQLNGKSISHVQDGQGGWKTLPSSWTATVDHNRFSWKCDTDRAESWGAYDGHKWYYFFKEYPPSDPQMTLQIFTKSDVLLTGESIEQHLTNISSTQPLDLAQFLANPWDPHNRVPLYDIVSRQAVKMVVTGKEVVEGQPCYHLHITYKASANPDHQSPPQDIWFAVFGTKIVPWQIAFAFPPNGNTVETITFTGSQTLENCWIPTGYIMAIKGWVPKGWFEIESRHSTFSLTDINSNFPDSAFQIERPANGRLFIDNTKQKAAPTTHQSPIIFLIRSCLALIVFVTIILLMPKRRGQK